MTPEEREGLLTDGHLAEAGGRPRLGMVERPTPKPMPYCRGRRLNLLDYRQNRGTPASLAVQKVSYGLAEPDFDLLQV